MSHPFPNILVYSRPAKSAERYRELILDRYPQARVAVASSPEEAESHLATTEVLYGWLFPHAMLRRMPRLRWLQKMSAGVEDVMLSGSVPDDIVVTKADGKILAPRMAEYVIAAIYNHTLKNHVAFEQQQRREWQQYDVDLAAGKTLGIAGLGDIGTFVARFARAVGLRTIGWRRSNKPCDDVDALFYGDDGLAKVAERSDFIAIVLPLTSATRGVLSDRVFEAVKPGAVLINVGRGAVIDDAALIGALNDGRIGAAYLDVFAEEPLAKDHPFWGMPNVHITPHVSGPVVPDEVVGVFLDNLDRYMNEKPLRHLVDQGRGY